MKMHGKLIALSVMSVLWSSLSAAPVDWRVNVDAADKVSSACTSNDVSPTCFVPSTASKVNIVEDKAVITVSCASKAQCDTVKVAREENATAIAEVTLESADTDGKTKRFVFDKGFVDKQLSIGIFLASQLKLSFSVGTTTVGTQTSNPAANSQVNAQSCSYEVQLSPYPTGSDGRAKKNITSTAVVDLLGNVLAKTPNLLFDENDTLEVRVIGLKSILDKLEVKRTSSFRDLSVVRLIGEGTTVPAVPGGDRQASVTDPCIVRFYTLTDFAPGRGVVELSTRDAGKTTKVGEFDLQVNPLYVGMFTVGWINSKAVDPGFKLVNSGTQNVIAPADISTKDNLYTVFVTPFIWGKRDLEKPLAFNKGIFERINPSIGLVIDDIKNNVLLGASIDLPAGVLLTFGKHYRRTTVLSPQSGLQLGSPFAGAATDVPTAKSWQDHNFYGVSIDLRIMAKFFATLGSSGK